MTTLLTQAAFEQALRQVPAELAKEHPINTGYGALRLLCYPNGSRLWQLPYRLNGQQKRHCIGSLDRFTYGQAKDAVDAFLLQLKNGFDPAEEARKRKVETATARLVADVADEWLAKMIPVRVLSAAELAAGKVDKTRNRELANVAIIKAAWGKLYAREITVAHMLALLDPLEAAAKFDGRKRLQSTICRIWGYARGHGYIPENISINIAEVRNYSKPADMPMPAIVDPLAFGRVLRRMDRIEETVDRLLVKLHTLVVCRPGELTPAEWTDVVGLDGDAPMLVIPVERLKMRTERKATKGLELVPHFIPLSRQAVAVLGELRAITGAGRYLFPSKTDAAKPVLREQITDTLGLAGIDTAEHCAHGTRSTFSTTMNDLFDADDRRIYEQDIVELQLDHVTKARLDNVARIYDRGQKLPLARSRAFRVRARLMQHWADLVDEMRITKHEPVEAAPAPALRLVA